MGIYSDECAKQKAAIDKAYAGCMERKAIQARITPAWNKCLTFQHAGQTNTPAGVAASKAFMELMDADWHAAIRNNALLHDMEVAAQRIKAYVDVKATFKGLKASNPAAYKTRKQKLIALIDQMVK